MKWKFLVKKLEHISFLQSFKAVLAGVTVSIFTPNRVGEFGGRIFALKTENRIAGIPATIAGSISQVSITFMAGLLAILIYYFTVENSSFESYSIYPLVPWIAVILIGISFLFFLNLHWLIRLPRILPFLAKYAKYFSVFASYNKAELLKIQLISLLRYMVFASQYVLLMLMLGLDIEVLQAYLAISLIYFVSAFIPSVALTEIGIKGSISISVLELFSPEPSQHSSPPPLSGS